MKKITFEMQLKISIGMLLIGCILSFCLKLVLFIKIAGVIFGFLFAINPVCPERFDGNGQVKTRIRLVGIFIAVFSILVCMEV